ncbi:MAG: hypothetical protein AAGA93_00220 [Actinomycetota bacterium]
MRRRGHDSPIDLDELDLDRYDLPGLRADINQIVDLQGAALRIVRWTVLVPLVGAVATWLVFRPRMPIYALVPYVLVVIACLVVAAIAIGVALVLRTKVDETNVAADRVVTTVAALHGDYLRIRTGEVDVPMEDLARLLTSELVFPALVAGSGRALATATLTAGPLGWVLRGVSGPVLPAVERRVLDALSQVDDPEPRPDDPPPIDGPRSDGADLVEVAATAGLPPAVADWYGAVHRHFERLTGMADTVTDGSTTVLVVTALLPLAAVLAAGWSLS